MTRRTEAQEKERSNLRNQLRHYTVPLKDAVAEVERRVQEGGRTNSSVNPGEENRKIHKAAKELLDLCDARTCIIRLLQGVEQ